MACLHIAGGSEEQETAAADKETVIDPTTGKTVTAPEYGGSITFLYRLIADNTDPAIRGVRSGRLISSVNEKLGIMDWGVDRREYDLISNHHPTSRYKGNLAASWSQPDPLTYVFNIRQGVHWQDKAPMNGRELTADDIVYNYQRYAGIGGFPEPQQTRGIYELPIDSITATDRYTMVVTLTESRLHGIRDLLQHWLA